MNVEILKKDCVSYNQAKKLKKLGFDEITSAYYDDDKQIRENVSEYNNSLISYVNTYKNTNYVTSPTIQQALRWIRDNYRLHHIHLMANYYLERGLSYEESEIKALDNLLETLYNTKNENNPV